MNIILYYIDFVDGAMMRELARRSVEKQSNSIRLIRYNSLIRYVFDINELFEACYIPSCDTFLNRAPDLERTLTTCKKEVKSVYPKNVLHLRETLFDKFDSLGISYTENQKFFNNVAFLNFESVCVQVDNFKDAETTTWIG